MKSRDDNGRRRANREEKEGMKEAKVIHAERQYQQHSQPVSPAWHPECDADRNATILRVGTGSLSSWQTIFWPISLGIWQIEADRLVKAEKAPKWDVKAVNGPIFWVPMIVTFYF